MPLWRPRVEDSDTSGRELVGVGSEKDSALSAIAKWVPIEVIAFYEALTKPFGSQLAPYLPAAILVGIVITFLWIAVATEDNQKIAWRQAIVSSIAFPFWVIGTSTPEIWKLAFSWWHPGIGPAALAFGAVLLPISNGLLKRAGVPPD